MKRRAYSADDQRQNPNDQRRQALDERVDPRRYQLLLAAGGMVMKVLGFQPRAKTYNPSHNYGNNTHDDGTQLDSVHNV